jgi:3',5'-cyclic AMP phosphodiesterase CpdA
MRSTLLVTALLLACDPPAEPGDGGVDAARQDGGDPHMGERLPRCEDTEEGIVDALPPVASTLEARIETVMPRLAEAGPENPATEEGELLYRGMGLSRVRHGEGRPLVLRNELGGETPPTTGRRSIGWLAIHSDFQLVDDESPSRLALFDNPVTTSALRAHEAYLARGVSAMNATFERIAAAGRPFDFGIITGDCADGAQYNELRWVIDLMNGATVEPDSGDDDDPTSGPSNDPKDPFDAVAFPAPWLYVPGNHDVELVGITAPDEANRLAAVGDRSQNGARDYRLWYAPARRATITADPARRIVSREDIVAELRADTAAPGPVGHGYPADADTSLGAHYVYDAIPGLLRIVALDTSDVTGGSEGLVRRATIDDFLVPALEQAAADGVLVMLASHHATTSIDVYEGQLGMTVVPDAVPADELEALVASHEVVIAWLVGHSHDNRIRAVGHDASHRGYWEVMTAALADWPGQARTLEVVDNGDGTLSLLSVTIDFDADDCQERRLRALLAMEWASGWVPDVNDADEHHDVEMVVAIPATAAAAVAAASVDAPTELETLTTLRGM